MMAWKELLDSRARWLLAALALVGACNGPIVRVTPCRGVHQGHVQEAQAFIVDCAAAANPMSDEEGEDLVAQCERTAERLWPAGGLCVLRHDGREIRCDSTAISARGDQACRAALEGGR